MAISTHTSHLTQPLDKTPFATLKTAWNENLTEYLCLNMQDVECQKWTSFMFFGQPGSMQ